MEIKRFDSMFEAAKKGSKTPAVKKTDEEKDASKASKGNLKKQLHDYLVDELKKKKMTRSDMLNLLGEEFGDNKNTETAIETAVDDIMHDPMKTKLNVESDRFKGGVKSDSKRYYPYFYIGTEAKDPSDVEKEEKKEPKERGEVTKKGKKVENFADFKKEKTEEKEEKSDKPKFGSAEWREMYAKGKKKEEKEPKEDKKEKKDKPVKESRIPKFNQF